MKIGFKAAQTNVHWPTLLATWAAADEMRRPAAEVAEPLRGALG